MSTVEQRLAAGRVKVKEYDRKKGVKTHTRRWPKERKKKMKKKRRSGRSGRSRRRGRRR